MQAWTLVGHISPKLALLICGEVCGGLTRQIDGQFVDLLPILHGRQGYAARMK